MCGLVQGKTLGHFLAHIYLSCFICKLELGHDGTDVKSWENQPYELAKYFLGLFDPLSEGVQKNSVKFGTWAITLGI